MTGDVGGNLEVTGRDHIEGDKVEGNKIEAESVVIQQTPDIRPSLPCKYCQGEGSWWVEVDCPACDGRGVLTRTAFDGQMRWDEPCEECGGRWADPQRQKEVIKGSGKYSKRVACKHCNGQGWVRT